MQIRRYGITLLRLTLQDIELVRNWRNHPEISRYMEYQAPISPEMQQAWFESINNHQNYFYLIIHQQKKLGLISTFNINWTNKTAHAGIFVWDENYLKTTIPVMAVLAMLDINFSVFGIQKMFIKVSKHNKQALVYNKALGYQLIVGEEEKEFQFYELSPSRYQQKTKKLRTTATKMSDTKNQTLLELHHTDPIELAPLFANCPNHLNLVIKLPEE